ncbi:hypothetical protein ACGF4C_13215 [Streptomyces sp. NPDC048197]|uniref:hypothetical protein n=1 Tax=Streptomyces sp. NPDC048197 TaxID=3365511 RepID=UPI00371051CB
MTQSGQGHDPQNSAAGPAREGIVLPANGEPYIPDQQAAPSAGQPWGQPWGPGQQAAPAPQSAPAPQQPYGQAPVQGQNYGQEPGAGQNYGQLPGQNYSQGSGQSFGQGPGQNYGQAPSQGYGYPPAQDAGAPVPGAPAQGAQAPGAQAPQAPLPPQQPGGQGFPSAQGQPPVPPMPPSMPPQAPAPQLPPQQAPGQPPAPQPYDQQPYGQQPPQQGQPQEQPGQLPMSSGELVRATRQAGAPLPPATGDAEATTVIPPFDARSGGPGGAAPLPPEAASRPESPDESTTMLRAVKPGQGRPQGQGQPMPGAAMPGAGGGSDSEATQLIPPVGAGVPTPPPGAPFGVRPGAPGDRPTPAEFDGLFRDGPAAAPAGAPDATAQLPRFEDPGRPPYGGQGGQGYGQQFPSGGYDQQGPYDPQGGYDEDGGGRRRRLAPMAIVGIVIVALAGAGLGVGWALSGGSSDDTAKKQGSGGGSTKAAKESEAPKATADPAEAQAKGLDALLGDSNNSRSSVIGAVNNIKSCSNLGNAAKDLRAAAGQRNDLVKRLQQLPVDKIPDHDRLTAALTKAWQSSAAADNHYAAWAGQLGGKKGCHKGRARGTRQAVQGNAASSQATQAKKQAAQLWNPLAQKYGLTERRPEQL